MPHSSASNERRRALYREARLLGFSPRDAGHVYSTRTVERLRDTTTGIEPTREGTQKERQEKHRQFLEVKRGKPVSLLQSREDYRAVNYALYYTKVELTLARADGSDRIRKTVTVTSDRALSRGELRERVEGFMERGAKSPFGGSDRALLEAVKFLSETQYPDVGY